MKWYCHIKGQQYGPVEEETLRSWISEGRVMPDDLIWAEGMPNWVKAETLGTLTGGDNGIAGTGGMTPCRDIRAKAREALAGKWGMCALYMLGWFVIIVIGSILTTYPIPLTREAQESGGISWGRLIFEGPLTLGFAIFFLALVRGQAFSFGTLFAGFKRFGGALWLYWCMGILVFLWLLLLIIPGIMAIYSYAMAYYVYADNPELGAMGSIKRSKELMYGHRLKLFWLGLTFIGWSILCVLTCGIGYLWLAPYIQTSFAIFYHDIQKPMLATRMETAPQTNPQPFGVVSGGQPAEESAPRDLSQPVNPQQ